MVGGQCLSLGGPSETHPGGRMAFTSRGGSIGVLHLYVQPYGE